MDSELQFRVLEPEAAPLYFSPLDDIEAGAPSIIDGF
jgi:hypothetical protein